MKRRRGQPEASRQGARPVAAAVSRLARPPELADSSSVLLTTSSDILAALSGAPSVEPGVQLARRRPSFGFPEDLSGVADSPPLLPDANISTLMPVIEQLPEPSGDHFFFPLDGSRQQGAPAPALEQSAAQASVVHRAPSSAA